MLNIYMSREHFFYKLLYVYFYTFAVIKKMIYEE